MESLGSVSNFISVMHHFQIDHNAPCSTAKILHNHCFQFFLVVTVEREIEDKSYSKFWE